MYKAIFTFIVLFFPLVSFACAFPQMGSEFDKLIDVEKVSYNKFQMSAPIGAGNLSYGAEIIVGYYPSGNKHRFAEYWKDVNFKEEGSRYVASFELKKIDGYTAYLQVFWHPEKCCSCGAYGKSEDLILE